MIVIGRSLGDRKSDGLDFKKNALVVKGKGPGRCVCFGGCLDREILSSWDFHGETYIHRGRLKEGSNLAAFS